MTDKFVAAIQNTRDAGQLQALGQGLAAVAAKVAEAQTTAMTDKFVAAIQASRDYYQLLVLGKGLAAVAGKVVETKTGIVIEKFLAAIQTTQDGDGTQAFGQGLAAVAAKVAEAQAGIVMDKFLAALQATQDHFQLQALGQGVAAVASRINDDQRAASVLFELLKNPLLPQEALTDAIRKRFPDAPSKDQGFWALIEWADKQRKENRFLDLDLASPLKQPIEIAAASYDQSK